MTRGTVHICLLALAAQIAVSEPATAQSIQATSKQHPALMERQKEIALALSACPPLVASKAAVYVLDTSGYIKVPKVKMPSQRLFSTRCPRARNHNAWMLRAHALFFRAI